MILNPYQCASVPRTTACKVCHGLAKLTAVVDFSRCGADALAGRKVDPYDGTPVYYYLCQGCGFCFTRAFDHWTTGDFARHVYNADYERHDPDYLDARPRSNAAVIADNFGLQGLGGGVLDYGSGRNLLEQFLRERGFNVLESFDPFTSPQRPGRLFEMITCFEVFEHSVDPDALLTDLKSFLAPEGAIFFSTQLCTPEVVTQGVANWWYCSPRNGHVSFYSQESLTALGRRHGLQFGSFNASQHVLHTAKPPRWLAAHLK